MKYLSKILISVTIIGIISFSLILYDTGSTWALVAVCVCSALLYPSTYYALRRRRK